jgi:hypothetical protein
MRAAFFGQASIVMHFMEMFRSSHPTLTSEKEIPSSMIALAATAVKLPSYFTIFFVDKIIL